MQKLNLGCGFDKRAGFVNADRFPLCRPDVLFDIDQAPWPWRDNSFGYILLKHVLEHVGADFSTFSDVLRELYRVAAPGGTIEIHVPDYRHESWWADPTHVRAFTPLTFQMLSKKQNDAWIAARANFTMLAHVLDVDFEVIDATMVYDPQWWQKTTSGEIAEEQLHAMARHYWGIYNELQVRLRVVKAAGE